LRVQHKLFGGVYRKTMAHYDEVVGPIGQGAMGMIYEARDMRLNRRVALKLVLPETLQSTNGMRRLLGEARSMARISHPNVVAIYEVDESEGVGFIAMELVRGVTLRKWLENAPRSLLEIIDVFVQAGTGLAAAHHAEIIHRDFKPDNVLVGEDGRARVLDFGLAFPQVSAHATTPPRGIPVTPSYELPSASSESHMLAGTIAYMSPEQLQGHTLDHRSDQFSFCVALYEALYRQRPFSGSTFYAFVDRVRHGEFAPVAAPPRLPSWVKAVLRRGLSGAVDQRYASMPELLSVLTAGRHMMASQRVHPPAWNELRERLLAVLACTLDEHVTSLPATALVRVQQITGSARWLAVVPYDPHAPKVRAAFATYFERLHAAELPRSLRPTRLVDDPACLALMFEDLECVTLGGLIRQTTGRDPALALQIARALTQAVYALAQLGYALDPAALENLPIGLDGYEIGPIDPAYVRETGADATGRYRIVGALLVALLTSDVPELGAVSSGPGGAGGPGGTSGPTAHDDRLLPPAVRALVDRLLDPGPGGYRSARGVLHDLALCTAEIRDGRARQAVALGTRDVGGTFRASSVMHGRRRELEQFETIAREIGAGRSGLVLLSGPSGVGKTLLIHEMGARQGRGWRIQGKFDQYANNEPYATLTQALRGLIGQIFEEAPAARDGWRDRIVRAVAPNAELLFSVIPELRDLIGDQPAAAVMPPVESAARFGETLKRLLVACAAQIELLVVVLDDMQWCDPASIRLICSLLGDREVGHILWICAFRDADHPLFSQLAACPTPNARKMMLPIGPLSHDELQAFLTDTLGWAGPRAASLATFFHDKTDGNPLFAHTLLTSLYEQGLFTFSPHHERWEWNDEAIHSAELPGDIQELIVKKIESLAPPAREILSVASCVGRDVEAQLMVEVVSHWGFSRDDLTEAIRACVARGLLARTFTRAPDGGDGETTELLNFTHDRVQQTAYSFLDPARRETVLLETGRALLDRSSHDEVAARLFRIVSYLNGGAAQASRALKERIVELNLIAAQRALVANAFTDSARFLQAALALLPEDRWTSRYDQTVELYVKYMHARALLGDRGQEDELFELLREHVRTGAHIGQIYELKVMLESSRGEHQAAIERGIAGLRALGERLPRAPGRLAALTELLRTWRALRRFDPDDLMSRPSSGTEDAPVSRLLVALSQPAYLADANLTAIVMTRIIRRSLAFGMSDASSHGFAGFGLIVSGMFGRYEDARRYAMVAHQLDQRFGNPWLAPKVDLVSGIFIQPWTRPFEHCEDVLVRGARVAVDNADFAYASYTSTSLACLLLYRGANLGAIVEYAATALRHTHRARDYDMETVVTTVIHASLCLRGETAGETEFSTPEHDDRELLATLDERTTPIGVFFCRAIRCGVLYLHGRADLACELGRQASAFEHNAFSNPSLAEYLFYYAMALLQQWPALTGPARRDAKRLVRRALARFSVWARTCPENFAARHALLEAELARTTGRGGVLAQLNAAIELAVRHGRVQYEALAAELAANHCEAIGQAVVAQIYLERARGAYRRWGAQVKVQQLSARLAPAAA
ncbi:MAG TPA: AAA family ATPase, partial [Kofleriaceae bacterium]|nr:AAA family ATPase [Kofleriaceae bacterium]